MQVVKVKRGLDVPITGQPKQLIDGAPDIKTVAVLGGDYVGMRPGMEVKVGDKVRVGQPLFIDKKNPGVVFTAPGSGRVSEINRGHKRALQSVVIELDGKDAAYEEFTAKRTSSLPNLQKSDVEKTLLRSGLWAALRSRPYSKIPTPGTTPHSIFVTAIDSNPLAADPMVVINNYREDFANGLQVLSHLTDGKLYVCQAPGQDMPGNNEKYVTPVAFSGPHPAGLAGTHIHYVDPVHANKTVWHLGYQDVIAIGKLFTEGQLWLKRYVSVAGPIVNKPRIIETRLGASIVDMTTGMVDAGDNRLISGSVLSGHTADGPLAYLGRYHVQVSAIREGRERVFMGWQDPGFEKFSVKNIFMSRLIPGKRFAFTTSRQGSKRAMVPIGMYEQVLPIDTEPTFLLRSLIVRDTDQAQALGCLELDEEDLALCTFVCPGKYVYGPLLRQNLELIEKEG